jgi:signal transduction histidine kinase/CheY-like chemotaxis protein
MLASILLVDPDGLHLRHGAAPSLPAAYTQAIDGMAIGPDAGPCGAAAYRCATVIVADIARDPTWQPYRDLALPHGLRACWSTPIVAGDGTVLGTFALYYREPRVPDGRDLRLIETAAHIARVAIERQRADTERATLFARAEGARAEAEAANRAKDHFLAVLSHELRNPLAAIANAVASLDRIGLQRPDAVRLREIVRRQVQHLRRLLDDLLDVTRLAYGKLDLRREPLDLREVVSRCVEGLESSGRLAGHPVTIVPGPESVPVEGDRVRLEQIVGNLLDNAAKYSPEGRSITVAVGRAEGQAVLRVRDAGIGLEPGALERIFEPFAQLRGQPGGGLGLGLALARGLVRQHGGSIVARSEGEGRGSEFEVRLPLAPEAAGRRAVSAAGPAPRRRRIVVVEDLADARATLTTLLELLGHEVQAAADGERAVEMILAMRPDVALVDVGLPGIDGHEVARRVRAAVGGAVYLVALTGYGQPYDRERAHQAGFDRHMVKPVDAAELERALGDHPLDPDAST